MGSAELTVGMDWYTRCVVGIRLTPVSTKSEDAAAVLFQAYRPRPAGKDWPAQAVWPEHGIPRSVLIDVDAVEGALVCSCRTRDRARDDRDRPRQDLTCLEHLTSVSSADGNLDPTRPVADRPRQGAGGALFRTLREDLFQILPGYKGPDVHSRGLDRNQKPSATSTNWRRSSGSGWRWCITTDRTTAWSTTHCRGCGCHRPRCSEHGVARAGYIEVPAIPIWPMNSSKTDFRKIQHYGWTSAAGATTDRRSTLSQHDQPVQGKAKAAGPFTTIPTTSPRTYSRSRDKQVAHADVEHAPSMQMPLSEEALQFARKLAAAKYTYPDDRLAIADLLERWNLGLGTTLAERRMALRLSRDAALIDLPEPTDEITTLPSVARVLATASPPISGLRGRGAPGTRP